MPKTTVRDPPRANVWTLAHCPPSSELKPGGNTGEIKATRKGTGHPTSQSRWPRTSVLSNRHFPNVWTYLYGKISLLLRGIYKHYCYLPVSFHLTGNARMIDSESPIMLYPINTIIVTYFCRPRPFKTPDSTNYNRRKYNIIQYRII